MLQSNAVIYGLKGHTVTDEEKAFFQRVRPFGFIVFARNIDTPDQVRTLVADLREIVGWHCPVLIDQEGGRVARLKPPHWPKFPPMSVFTEMAKTNLDLAEQEVHDNYRAIGKVLDELHIDVDCAPVCDILFEDAHDIVGDRSFGRDPLIVARLARKAAEGLMEVNITPIIKHIPGHGRAKADSHLELPVVKASLKDLWANDFLVFKELADMPWAMTAHILYTALDKENPATSSPTIIKLIREEIGFKGILVSDDLSMKALTGTYEERTRACLEAGCDIVLHCNGEMEEMLAIANGVSRLSEETLARLEKEVSRV